MNNLGFELWQIDQRIDMCVDDETGEIIEENLYEALIDDKENLIESAALAVKNMNAELEAVKNEKQKFYERQKQIESKIDTVKNVLKKVLDGEKVTTPKVKISFRKTQQVEIKDIDVLDDEFKKIEFKPDKTAIKAAIKAGKFVDGACLVDNTSIQIK